MEEDDMTLGDMMGEEGEEEEDEDEEVEEEQEQGIADLRDALQAKAAKRARPETNGKSIEITSFSRLRLLIELYNPRWKESC